MEQLASGTIAVGTPTVPSPGQLVSVRQRRYVVTDVVESAAPVRGLTQSSPPPRRQHLLHLQSIDDDGMGEELSVVWELEPGTHVFERTALPDPARGFDDPARLDAFLNAVRWGAVASADVSAIHAPFRSGVTIEDYQLDPLARAVEMPRVSLLIADDVGLGKTIEAGLVMQELLLRYRARTVLVVCPAGLQLQWRDQMRDKFGLEFRIIDSEALRDLRRRRGLQVNPWTHFPRLITSIDFLKRDRPMRMMREVLPAPGEPVYPRRFDLLIVDEAHNVAPSGRGNYAIDSQRTDCIRMLAPHFEHKLFLTATPHNGYTESFASLLELLDDQRFHRGMEPDKIQLERVMVRRLKKELPRDNLGRARFPARSLEAIEVEFTEEERKAHDLLQQYADLRSQNGDDESDSLASQFVMKLLKKRLFSSPEAFRLTLETHVKNIATGKKKELREPKVKPGILRREIARIEEDYDQDELYEEETAQLVRTTTRSFRALSREEQNIVDRLLDWANKAASRLDTKAKGLVAWLESIVRPDGKWNDTRVIIFTEYRATQKWLEEKLAARGFTQHGRLLTLYGGMNPEEREAIKHAFQASPKDSPVRILLATDAASEGIDLQNHCSRLLHYEIPWNPNRMEQRNGRVDRHGQKDDPVRIFHFVGKGWHEQRIHRDAEPGSLVGDLEFLFRAAQKVDQIREDLGNAGDVIAVQVEEAMLGKRKKLDTERDAPRSSAARKMLTFERDLEKRLTKLMNQLHESRDELHIAPEALESVVAVGLQMAGHPPLQPIEIEGRSPGTKEQGWVVPALRGTWASCLDGLPHPHTQEMRPITFDYEVARDRDDVVFAHLGHRLVQMCVGLLRAEVWAPEGQRKLARVAARAVPRLEQPALVAYARLVMLGGDNVRLHEEVLTAGGLLERGKFVPLTGSKLSKILSAAGKDAPRDVPDPIRKDLVRLWGEHRTGLEKVLEGRADERQDELREHLEKRCEREVADITAILNELERSIGVELKEHRQLELFERERDQFERNRDALKARLTSIPNEIKRETQAIRARYSAPVARLFPVAVTWFVPSTMVSR